MQDSCCNFTITILNLYWTFQGFQGEYCQAAGQGCCVGLFLVGCGIGGCGFWLLVHGLWYCDFFNQEWYYNSFQTQYINHKQKMHNNQPNDPYFTNPKLNSIDTNFLNFTPYANNTNPQIFCFIGNAYQLKNTVKNLTETQLSQIKSLRISIIGNQVKNIDNCCFWSTILCGSLVLFPWFFLCCDWWKRRVNKLYHVDNQGYDALTQLIKKCQTQQLYLMIQDNFFNRSKAEVIIQTLQASNVRNFVFVNIVGEFDVDGSNYTKFGNYMKPIKGTLIRSDVRWGNLVVL